MTGRAPFSSRISLWAAMSPEDGKVVFRYGDHEIETDRDKRLLDAILEAGFDHRHICGGLGFCTSCRVEVVGGAEFLSPVSATERERLGRDAGRLRQACQTYITGPASVRVPPPAPSRFSPDDE
jgi:ferredoxin, 2Fe-2S